MSGHPITVAGIPVPSDAPLFFLVLGVHVLFGMTGVVTGCVAMLSPKGPGRHPRFGACYYWSLAIVFASAATLSAVRWADDYPLFVLGTLSFVSAAVARTARRHRWRRWARLHIGGMGGSYILLLTAFYVDNGPNLPLWGRLQPIAFWTLPAAVGLPLLVWQSFRHPLARSRAPAA